MNFNFLKLSKKGFLILLVSILIFSFFRKLLLPFLPLVLILIAFLFDLKLTYGVLAFLIVSILILFIGSFLSDAYFLNTVISLLICYIPCLFLLLKPTKTFFSTHQWFKFSSIVLTAVNISAFIDFIYVLISKTRLLDDGFIGLYGSSGLNMHTLSIINFIYAVYYFDQRKFLWFSFYVFSGFMCFYGLGLLLFILSFALCLLFTLKKKFIIYIIISPIFVLLVVLGTSILNPKVYSYMSNNVINTAIALKTISYEDELDQIREYKRVKTPRKILSFIGAYKRLISSSSIMLFGTSPGTYNSRTSFLLNGEYSSIGLAKRIENRPLYAEEDIYPLWNKNITYQYNDGTRNQPFSSVLSFTMEYGALISIIFFLMFKNKYDKVLRFNMESKLFVRFFFLFFVLNLLVENYLEYPELIILVIIILKTLEANVQNPAIRQG